MTKLANRVISIFNRKTSMRLAMPEWDAVDDICRRENIKRKRLFEIIENNKDPKLGFTCSVRLFAITYMHKHLPNYLPKQKNGKNNYEDIFETIKFMS